jgi:sugar phosphate permease
MLCLLWSLHGLFQGISGPAITKLVVQLSLNNNTTMTIDTIWSILICAGNLGYLIGPFILIPIIDNHDWKFCYKILGLVGISISGLIHLMISNNNDTSSNFLSFCKNPFWFFIL